MLSSVSVFSLPVFSILLLQVHQDQALFLPAAAPAAAAPAAAAAAAVPAIGAAPLITPAAGVAALAILAKLNIGLVGLLVGRLASRAGNNRSTSRSNGRRGKRSVEEELELEVDLKLLTEMEPGHCYKRVICAANTGKYYTQNLDGIMSLINEKATDLRAAKFLAAAQYGYLTKDVAKCEHRYQCSMDLEIIQTVF